MGAVRRIGAKGAMASRWRRRPLCVLVVEEESPAALRHLSGAGAFLQTSARPPLGTAVTLRHPEAGPVDGHVIGVQKDGIALRFAPGPSSIAWAMTAIAADMSRPA